MPHRRSIWLVGVVLLGVVPACGSAPTSAAQRPDTSAMENPVAATTRAAGRTCGSLMGSYLGNSFRRSYGGVTANRMVLARWLSAMGGSANGIAEYPKYANIRRGEQLQICVGGAAGLVPPGPPGHPMADTIVIVFPSTGAPVVDSMGPRSATLDLFARLRALPGAQSVR